MNKKILQQDIDANPYTGVKEIEGYLRIADKPWLKGFFDGSNGYEQVKNVTIGKVYKVVRKEGYGDGEDITFINDIGEEETLADAFFEEVNEDYSIMIEYLEKAKECTINIEQLSQKFKEVLILLEIANIEPEIAFNYLVINLDRMKENNELYD